MGDRLRVHWDDVVIVENAADADIPVHENGRRADIAATLRSGTNHVKPPRGFLRLTPGGRGLE